MTNWEIAQELNEIRKLLELKGQRESASLFEQYFYTILALDFAINNNSDLSFFPTQIREEIGASITFGFSPLKEQLKKEVPKGLRVILDLPGIRPENAIKIYERLNVENINDLKEYVFSQKLRTIKDFGRRFEEQLRRSITNYENKRNELSFFEIYSYVNSIKILLNDFVQIEIAGSARRGKEQITNVDFVIASESENIKDLINKKMHLNYIKTENNIIFYRDRDGFLIKFYIVPPEYFFSALQFYTGSKAHNKALKEIAKSRGINASKYGYLLIKAKNEKEIYNILGLQFIPEEIREGSDEIELARRGDLPNLISIEDIRGDLHVHSNFSDGLNSIEEIKEEASFMKYEYLAITDHTKSLWMANGLDKRRLSKQIEVINKINSKDASIRIFKGIESEIGEEGYPEISRKENNKLDIILGALHNYSQDKDQNTRRIINSFKRGIDILAHPSGRIVKMRSPLPFDFDEIINESINKGIILEINLFPTRLDLSVDLIKQCRRKGVRFFSIGTDAHNRGHLNFMKLGIKLLRRAWIEPKEVLNSYDSKEIEEIIWKKIH